MQSVWGKTPDGFVRETRIEKTLGTWIPKGWEKKGGWTNNKQPHHKIKGSGGAHKPPES
jgi:hypothetical protein